MSDLPPLTPGLADDLATDAGCDCCEGIAPETPLVPANRPGLKAVVYRPGTHADFVASQQAALSGAGAPALAGLKARDTRDFSIALIDAWACVCEVLSFYQERLANEAWLGTAQERRSVVELGRLIGYRPRPGVAAATDLVFTLDDPPGAPPHAPAVTIPAGTRVQSVPGPDEKPQMFETVEPIATQVGWNALVPRQSRSIAPANGQTGTWLQGVATGLKVGDAILITGRERTEQDAGSERWDFRILTAVEADARANRTWIAYARPLGSIDPPGLTAQLDHSLFALRTRASLFGWNAPHPNLLPATTAANYPNQINANHGDWKYDIDTANRRIHLDSIQSAFVIGSWIAMAMPTDFVEAYRITDATDDGRADYAVSARVSRLTLDSNEHLDWFESDYRRVSVYGQSERLAFAEWPVLDPVMGDSIELGGLVDDPGKGRRLVVRGRRAAVRAARRDLSLTVNGSARALLFGEVLALMGPPVPVSPGSSTLIWALRTAGGLLGTLSATATAFDNFAAPDTFETIAERATLQATDLADETHSRFRLDAALEQAFDRASTVVHANVAAATHGETTQELLGDGRAGSAFQRFQLKQAPLTFVSAATESGAQSTLKVTVDDVLWHEVPSLYGRGPTERVFESRLDDNGAAIVTFGDGRTGARLPTGRNNVVATYRKGIGVAGSIRSQALTTALDRPLGLKDVTNPLPAGGGQDAETTDSARDNAPVTVLTLGRVVSLQNYEDFARGFSGISKARADMFWDGETRRIVVSVTGPDGAPVDPAHGDVFANLSEAFVTLGDPFVRATLVSYRPATFRLRARVATEPDHDRAKVLAAVEARLRADWGFAARGFARIVASSAILASMHAVEGVVAVDLDVLHRTSGPQSAASLHARLLAQGVGLASDGTMQAAEILTLDPAPLGLEAMA